MPGIADSPNPGSTEPVRLRRSRGLVMEIVASLTDNIRAGGMQPGEKLPTEAEIMVRFDVSRTVVREALSKLDRKSTRLNSSHLRLSRMPSSA